MNLSQIIERVTVIEILGPRAASMKPTGQGKFRGICPIHQGAENKMSFSIDESKGFAHCFGCGENWNKIELTAALYGLTRKEAAHYLAGLIGATLDAEGSEDAVMAAEMRRAAAVEANAVVAWRNAEYFHLYQQSCRWYRKVDTWRKQVQQILAMPPAMEEHPDLGWMINAVMSMSIRLEEWEDQLKAMKKPDWTEWIGRYRRMIRLNKQPKKLSVENFEFVDCLINGKFVDSYKNDHPGPFVSWVIMAMSSEEELDGDLLKFLVLTAWEQKDWKSVEQFERQVLKCS